MTHLIATLNQMKMEKQNAPRVFLKDKKVIGYTGDMEREVLGYN